MANENSFWSKLFDSVLMSWGIPFGLALGAGAVYRVLHPVDPFDFPTGVAVAFIGGFVAWKTAKEIWHRWVGYSKKEREAAMARWRESERKIHEEWRKLRSENEKEPGGRLQL